MRARPCTRWATRPGRTPRVRASPGNEETRGKRREGQDATRSRARAQLLLSSAATRRRGTNGRGPPALQPFHWPVTTRLCFPPPPVSEQGSSRKVSIISKPKLHPDRPSRSGDRRMPATTATLLPPPRHCSRRVPASLLSSWTISLWGC